MQAKPHERHVIPPVPFRIKAPMQVLKRILKAAEAHGLAN